jgi:hypothetical protein
MEPSWAPCESCDCKDGNAGFKKWEIAGLLEPTARCPRRSISARTAFYLSLYPHYRAGHLLYAGGIADQPALFMEAMGLIQAETSSIEAEGLHNGS